MRLGISLPTRDGDGRAMDISGIMARARWVEDTGFDSIWMGDTFGAWMPRPDPLMWLLAAGASTNRVELGTAILQLPVRNPIEVAQRVMTMQALVGDRFTLGIGAGSRGSHAALGADYAERFVNLRRYLDIVQRLSRGERVGDAYLNPWPQVARSPRVLIGTWGSSVWLRRAARDYDGWMASATTSYETLAKGIKHFRGVGGRRAVVAGLLVDLSASDTPLADDAPFDLVCGPGAAAERLQRLAALGFDDALLIKTDHTRALNLYESDYSESDLRSYRALLPLS